MACDDCFSYFGMFAEDRKDALWNQRMVAMVAKRSDDKSWLSLLLTSGKKHDIYLLNIKPFLHYPAAIDCKAYSKDASVACTLRALVIMPLLTDSAMDFWRHDGITVRREWYHETLELILMFLQGRPTSVLRPLPSIKGLVAHGFLKIHSRFADWLKGRV